MEVAAGETSCYNLPAVELASHGSVSAKAPHCVSDETPLVQFAERIYTIKFTLSNFNFFANLRGII